MPQLQVRSAAWRDKGRERQGAPFPNKQLQEVYE